MHYMVVTSITVPLHSGCNSCNYIHYMINYMLSKMLMVSANPGQVGPAVTTWKADFFCPSRISSFNALLLVHIFRDL